MKPRLGMLLMFVALVLAISAAPAAAAGPAWKLTVTPSADYFTPGPVDQAASYTIEAENVGTSSTANSQPIVLKDTLPAGVTAEGVAFYYDGLPTPADEFPVKGVDLSSQLCPTDLECTFPGSLGSFGSIEHGVQRGKRLIMVVHVAVPAGTEGSSEDTAEVSGGGAAAAARAGAVNEAKADAPFGIRALTAPVTQSRCDPAEVANCAPYAQAGGHPFQLATEVNLATKTEDGGGLEAGDWVTSGTIPARDPRSINVELPPGLTGNPQAVPICSLADFFDFECPLSAVVGTVGFRAFGFHQGVFRIITSLYNLQPTGAYPGELGFIAGPPILLTAGLRSGSDYGLTIGEAGIPEIAPTRVRITTWGVPAAAAHNALRGKVCASFPNRGTYSDNFTNSVEQAEAECEGDTLSGPGGPAETPEVPFLTMPTHCTGAPLAFSVTATNWETPETATAATTDEGVSGCSQILFEPTIEARPTTNLADAPSGLEFDLKVPQNESGPGGSEDPNGVSTSALSEAVVKFPSGLTVNPSSGNGLGACSPQQIGLTTPIGQTPAHFTETPAQCPEQSAIGSSEVNTPLLHNPLKGTVFLAAPHQNPFGSLLAAYIVLEGEGLIIKLPGEIEADPQTGQLTGRFLENPQTPFEDFHLDFFGGARGDLRTPATCGIYKTTSVLTPYSAPESGPPGEPTSAFDLENGGAPCPKAAGELPNKPVFRAGTESPEAGRFTPFGLRLAREDGSQEISKIETTLPPGLTGRLAGVAECSEAQLAIARGREHEGGGAEEQASPSCPASSEVGTVNVAAGPTPLYVSGKAYLAGPYKGAPLSLAILTPAVAGPFDLGDVLVRTALYVDPFTTQIKAVSDPIPHILQGIPLDVRSVTLKMDRANFTLNPTNCEELGFTGSATSVLGAAAPLTQRFQVGGCRALPFKPKLALRLKGSPKRAKFPALTATLTMPPGEANIASAQVTLPHSSFLAQSHIAKTCGRPELASHTCPAASIYGHARAVTPLLDHPLEGPVYLATGFGYELPALVADLNGQIEVMLKGKVDSGRADGIRNTFEMVPDAPVSKFTLHMFGGKKSLIENSEYLCGRHAKRKALASFTGQNGRTVELEPTVKNSCGKKHKAHHHKHTAPHRGHGKRHGG